MLLADAAAFLAGLGPSVLIGKGIHKKPAGARTLWLAFSFSVRRSQATTNAE